MAGPHFPKKGVAGESRLVWSGWLSACHEAPRFPLPLLCLREQDREVPAAAFYPHRLSHLPPELGMGAGAVLLSQVECFETGSGKFLQTKVKTTKPCERLQRLQRSQRTWVVGEVPRFQISSWVKKALKGKGRGKAVFQCSARRWDLLDHTASRVIFLWWKNSHLKWVLLVAGDQREDRREGN